MTPLAVAPRVPLLGPLGHPHDRRRWSQLIAG